MRLTGLLPILSWLWGGLHAAAANKHTNWRQKSAGLCSFSLAANRCSSRFIASPLHAQSIQHCCRGDAEIARLTAPQVRPPLHTCNCNRVLSYTTANRQAVLPVESSGFQGSGAQKGRRCAHWAKTVVTLRKSIGSSWSRNPNCRRDYKIKVEI